VDVRTGDDRVRAAAGGAVIADAKGWVGAISGAPSPPLCARLIRLKKFQIFGPFPCGVGRPPKGSVVNNLTQKGVFASDALSFFRGAIGQTHQSRQVEWPRTS